MVGRAKDQPRDLDSPRHYPYRMVPRGKVSVPFLNTGGPHRYYEYKLKSALLSPLPDPSEYDTESVRLQRDDRPVGSFKIACIMVDPPMPSIPGQMQVSPLGLFSTYCFDPQTPALRVIFSFGTISTAYSKIVKVQGRFLGRELIFIDGKRRLLSASVDTIEGLNSSDAALTPPPEATVAKFGTVGVSAGIMVGQLLKKEQPIYPQDAKEARASGVVVIKATIGTDGGIHEMHIVSAPWPSLAIAALSAVSLWQYKPYLLNNEPVQVQTTINVIFTLGG